MKEWFLDQCVEKAAEWNKVRLAGTHTGTYRKVHKELSLHWFLLPIGWGRWSKMKEAPGALFNKEHSYRSFFRFSSWHISSFDSLYLLSLLLKITLTRSLMPLQRSHLMIYRRCPKLQQITIQMREISPAIKRRKVRLAHNIMDISLSSFFVQNSNIRRRKGYKSKFLVIIETIKQKTF
jgi:hypothetical protein